MVTTRRSETTISTYDSCTKGGVDLLVRPKTYEQSANLAANQESYEQASQRMQRNLFKLMNYDRFNAEEMQATQEVVEEKLEVSQPVDFSDEDIRPTSTTMQFGDDIEQIREEMKKSEQEKATSYHLNGKGKLAVILYSLVVTVVLALIVLNTGLLARLNARSQVALAEYNSAVEEYNAVMANIENISSADYVINVAENEYGMIKR